MNFPQRIIWSQNVFAGSSGRKHTEIFLFERKRIVYVLKILKATAWLSMSDDANPNSPTDLDIADTIVLPSLLGSTNCILPPNKSH
jgi:hypothetical protein